MPLATMTKTPVARRAFRAMGTEASVVVVGPEYLADMAVAKIDELKAKWSRFLVDSEISALNRARHGVVSAETYTLIDRAIVGWAATGGRFNPTMADQLCQAGYEQSFELIDDGGTIGPTTTPLVGGCAGIVRDARSRSIWLPDGVAIDPGGIGKGLAGDLVTAEIMAAGASGVLVNLGGDLRVRGHGPTNQSWIVAVREPMISDVVLSEVEISDAGMASSTPLRRRWSNRGRLTHHLLDPKSGTSNGDGPHLVTAVAGEAWWAEVVATATAASLRRTDGAETIIADSVATLTIWPDGRQVRRGNFERFER